MRAGLLSSFLPTVNFCLLIGPPGGSGLQEVHPAAGRLRGRLRDAEEVPRAGAQTGSVLAEQRIDGGAEHQHAVSLLTNHSSGSLSPPPSRQRQQQTEVF